MQIEKGNILSPKILKTFNAICFTSNGIVKANGELVMGAGVAKAFRNFFPRIANAAGKAVKRNGNMCQIVFTESYNLTNAPRHTLSVIAFPTKHNWRNPSDIKLIEKSAKELMRLVEQYNWKSVALTKPGCGMGGLKWESVKKVIDPIFDNRITIFYI